MQRFEGSKGFYLTLAALNVGSICMGMTIGSSDSSLLYFMVPRSVYKEELEDDTTMRSLMILGVSSGALLPVFLVDEYGRRASFGVSALVNAISWICLSFAQSKTSHVVGNFVAGFSGGIFQTTVALYVAEISSATNRGRLGALVTFCSNCGVILSECIVIFADFRILATLMTIPPLVFGTTVVFWMIESPYFLYQRGKILEAKLSLKRLRGARTVLDVDEEFKAMQSFFDASRNSSSKLDPFLIFRPRHSRRSLLMTLILLYVSQIVGGYAMADYAGEVLDTAIPHYASILFAGLDALSVGLCLLVIERIGRRPLLLVSVFGSSCCCLLLGIYRLALQNAADDVDKRVHLPTLTIASYYGLVSLGATPILPLLTGEIFPNRVKTVAIGFSVAFVYLSILLTEQVYHLLRLEIGGGVAFAVFASLGSLGLPLGLPLALPETTGKSLYQIQDEIEDVTLIMS